MRIPSPAHVAALIASAFVSCSPTTGEAPAAGAPSRSGASTSSSSVDDLRALGYAGVTDDVSADRRGGVVFADEASLAPGYNLTSVSKFCTADLFDARGQLLHRWQDATQRAWDHVELLPDGDLIVVGSDRGERKYAGALCEDHYVQRFDFDGNTRWKRPLRAHHDVQVTWAGDLMTLTASQRKLPDLDAEHDVIDNELTLLSPNGEVRESHSLHDICAKPESKFSFQRVAPNPNKKFPIVDAFHCNSIDFVREPALLGTHPLYAAHNVLVSSRHQDSLFIVDWDRKVVVWQWGQDELSGPHDARFLPNGNVLVFDNGMERRWTRILEVDPRTNRIVWRYQDPRDRSKFFSLSQGASQRFENGNTLIADSNSGRAFEVTADGRTVWEYLVPHFDDANRRAEIYRIRRYPPEYVEGILRAHGVALAGGVSSTAEPTAPVAAPGQSH
ncbi:MAG: aryl-sulfate sulfotransferase [Planctomycetes bacterium]|nr:aryl-sulfate sulfotransferase [Planctomycetota bacterium]